ncbi:MAG: sulfite exporter TauE/SafE family protein [Methanoregula sp.]|nr:MAG: sulfite exporter TauE/SafE family protein [Methanoregula sp.]
MLTGTELALAGFAAFAAGIINALAGGGTLVSFPALIAIGIPEVAANITNTVALCPGYLGGSLAQRKDLAGQGRRLRLFLPAGILGGIAGGVLLLVTGAQVFRALVPFLILLASFLLAVRNRLRDWISNSWDRHLPGDDGAAKALVPVSLTAVYGGYFGAGQSVIILSVLGLFISDNLTRLNALKQCITLASNVAAAVFFLFSGMIIWPVAAVMAAGALAGGAAGGRFAGYINPELLRWTVAGIGLVAGTVLLVRL